MTLENIADRFSSEILHHWLHPQRILLQIHTFFEDKVLGREGSREICAVCSIKLKKEKNEVSHDLISQKRLSLQIQIETGI